MNIYIHTYTYIYIYIHIYTRTHTHTCTYIHIYLHTYIYIYIYMLSHVNLQHHMPLYSIHIVFMILDVFVAFLYSALPKLIMWVPFLLYFIERYCYVPCACKTLSTWSKPSHTHFRWFRNPTPDFWKHCGHLKRWCKYKTWELSQTHMEQHGRTTRSLALQVQYIQRCQRHMLRHWIDP